MAHNQTRAMLSYASAGWKVFDSGWPDMLLAREFEDGRVILRFVEEKSGSRSFTVQQKTLLLLLERAGLDVFIILEGTTEREFTPSQYFQLEKSQQLVSGLAGTTIRNYRVKLRYLEAQLADLEKFDPMYDVTIGRINKLRLALGEGEIEKISEWTPEAIERRRLENIKKLDPKVIADAASRHIISNNPKEVQEAEVLADILKEMKQVEKEINKEVTNDEGRKQATDVGGGTTETSGKV